MKVILTDEIYGLGGRGEIITVKDGYARNYLLPKKLAKEATPGNITVVEQQKRKWAMLSQEEKKVAEVLAGKLGKVVVSIEKKVGESGTLYGSVTSHEIAHALGAQGFDVEKRQIELGEPIKTLGEHDVTVRLHREVSVPIKVNVSAEGQVTQATPAKSEARVSEAAAEPVSEEAAEVESEG